MDAAPVREQIAALARDEGFADIGVAGVELGADALHLENWLALGYHGEMHYMQRHGTRRSRPAELVPGSLRVIAVRMNYWPGEARDAQGVLDEPQLGYVSRYALGRDYHRLMRKALERLSQRIATQIGPHGYRVFVDSGPVLERALARNAGLGWIGKHTNLIARAGGSYFFLGEILTDLPLPVDEPATQHCGTCAACIPACPTGAIVAPYRLDARRCISYLTIELHGSIPVELRGAIGNRIYGCDDCQLVCPWNKFARTASHPDFKVRHGLDAPRLTELFGWSAAEFETRMQGSAIHRIGHARFLRNVAVALGNALRTQHAPVARERIVAALHARADDGSEMLREHVAWALAQQSTAHAA